MSLIPKRQCLFQSLTANEAAEYLSKQNISEATKHIMHFNPLLLSVLLPKVISSLEVKICISKTYCNF